MSKVALGLILMLLSIGCIYIIILFFGFIYIVLNNLFAPVLHINLNINNMLEYSGHGFVLLFAIIFVVGISYLIGNAILT